MKNHQLKNNQRPFESKAKSPPDAQRFYAGRPPGHAAIWSFASLILTFALLPPAFGQGAQGAQIKQRAKELVNQNNVRQGVPPPAAATPRPAAPAAPGTPAATNPVVLQAQNISKIKADLAGFKPNSPVTPAQKQQFLKDLAVAARSTKPSLPSVTQLVDTLSAALGENSLGEPEQARLAENLNSVLNSKPFPASQFDAIIADVQAILQVGGVKRSVAAGIAGNLKTVGSEVRR